MPFRILLVDDSPAFLATAAAFLAADPDLDLVGAVSSGNDALIHVARLQPDLVLMDIQMPELNGLETTRQIKAQPHAPRVVLMTLGGEDDYRAAAATAGADGFVWKGDLATAVVPLIHTLLQDPG